MFTPRTETQYGSMWCSASNSVGTGPPCVYIILPPGLHSASPACSATNITSTAFKVRRQSGDDGDDSGNDDVDDDEDADDDEEYENDSGDDDVDDDEN